MSAVGAPDARGRVSRRDFLALLSTLRGAAATEMDPRGHDLLGKLRSAAAVIRLSDPEAVIAWRLYLGGVWLRGFPTLLALDLDGLRVEVLGVDDGRLIETGLICPSDPPVRARRPRLGVVLNRLGPLDQTWLCRDSACATFDPDGAARW